MPENTLPRRRVLAAGASIVAVGAAGASLAAGTTRTEQQATIEVGIESARATENIAIVTLRAEVTGDMAQSMATTVVARGPDNTTETETVRVAAEPGAVETVTVRMALSPGTWSLAVDDAEPSSSVTISGGNDE